MKPNGARERRYDHLGPPREPIRNIETRETAQSSGTMVDQKERGWSLPDVEWPRPKGFS